MNIIDLQISDREAHVILRALAAHADTPNAPAGDKPVCTWVAERILRVVSPDLGCQPIASLLASWSDDLEAQTKKRKRKQKNG